MDEQSSNTSATVLDTLMAVLSEKLSDAENAQLFAENIVRTYTKLSDESPKDDFFFSTVKPFVSSLIRLKDDTAKELRQFEAFVVESACENDGTTYATEIMTSLVEGINDILLEYDVQPFTTEYGVFNPRRHQAVKKVITDDPALVKNIAKTLGCGYERKESIISKERVSVYAPK